MGKYKFKKLSRGVKLLKEHVYDPISTSLNSLTTEGVTLEQLEDEYSSFRVSLNIPDIDSQANNWSHKLAIPLILPPPQEQWSSTYAVTESTIKYNLNEISVSFDQRDEAAAIRSKYNNTANKPGSVDYGGHDNLEIQITILQSDHIDSANDENSRYTEVFSTVVDTILFGSEVFRFNPGVITGINKELRPYKTYFVVLSFPGLDNKDATGNGTEPTYCVPGFNISLKFNSKLMARESTGLTIQNAPGALTKVYQSTTITPPAPPALPTDPDVIIVADNTAVPFTPLQGAIETVDGVFQGKLKSGLDRFSSSPNLFTEGDNLQLDAGYTVIAVPMWGNLGAAVDDADKAMSLPGLPNVLVPSYIPCHRQVIPIEHPMVIHHVIAGYNYTGYDYANTPGQRPVGATWGDPNFHMGIGVAVGTGMKGELMGYNQVAYLDFTPDGSSSNIISRHNIPVGAASSTALGSWNTHNWDMLSVPLVGGQTATLVGAGYDTQGSPFYAGRSRGTTARGAAAYDTSTAIINSPPATEGQEQFLEVRWSYHPDLDMSAVYTTPAILNAKAVIQGRYGNWVYIIGKKILC